MAGKAPGQKTLQIKEHTNPRVIDAWEMNLKLAVRTGQNQIDTFRAIMMAKPPNLHLPPAIP